MKKFNDNHIVIVPDTDVHHVFDGGALLHRVSWPKRSTYEAICGLYLNSSKI